MDELSSEYNVSKIRFPAIIYAIYCALLPLNQVLNFTGFTVNRYVGILASISFLASILLRKEPIEIEKENLYPLTFLVWCMFTALWSLYTAQTFHQLITLTSLVSLTILGLMYKFNQREIRLIKVFMIIATTILILYLAPNTSVSVSRSTLTTSAGTADQNGLAANMLFALLMGIDEALKMTRKGEKILFSVLSIMIFVGLLLVASRGALIAMVISLIVYFYKELKNALSSFYVSTFIKIIVAVVCVILIISYILKNMEIPGLERLTSEAVQEDGGTGRFAIWKIVWKSLDGHLFRVLFGYGFGTEGYVTQSVSGTYSGIHNVYLEYLATTGIVGFTLLMRIFGRCFNVARIRDDHLSLALLVALMVVCFPLGFFLDKGAWNVFLLVMNGLNGFKDKEVVG